jgi:hypothetical protein
MTLFSKDVAGIAALPKLSDVGNVADRCQTAVMNSDVGTNRFARAKQSG